MIPGFVRASLFFAAIATPLVLSQGCYDSAPSAGTTANEDWPAYLGGVDSAQASSLSQIDRNNVQHLEVAWTYHSGGAAKDGRSQIQCNPLIKNGVVYATSAGLALFAIDGATGRELWRFDPSAGAYTLHGAGVNRGVHYWSNKNGSQSRILYAALDRLWSVDAETGLPDTDFGDAGSIDLHLGLGERAQDLFVVANTPGVVFEDRIILGHRVNESLPAAPGDIRAFDITSGELAWRFKTIPSPGSPGAETWPEGARDFSGGVNNWAGMSLDPERALVFVPIGSAAYDFYGGDRPGANLYANSLLALDARTGTLRWFYQFVHHDIWDRDLPAPPNLVTIRVAGRNVDAVAQITKDGHIFLFERDTGKPLFEIEEHPVPASDLEGEQAWPTQPIPRAPAPFTRQTLTEADLNQRNPEDFEKARLRLATLRSAHLFDPPSRQGTVIFPGYDGGGEWGGAAWDQETGMLYVNGSEMPWILTMVEVKTGVARTVADLGRVVYARHCQSCHGVDRQGSDGGAAGATPALVDLKETMPEAFAKRLVQAGRGTMPGFSHLGEVETEQLLAFLYSKQELLSQEVTDAQRRAYGDEGPRALRYVSTGYERFVDGDNNPVIKPPWGFLAALDLNAIDPEGSGSELKWRVPLGEIDDLTQQGVAVTGTENYGGPVVTAGGLVFIAASKDERIRAFDKTTGKQLWQAKLPAGGYATPATYSAQGRQFVVIAAGGGKMGTASGDTYVAFALPEKKASP